MSPGGSSGSASGPGHLPAFAAPWGVPVPSDGASAYLPPFSSFLKGQVYTPAPTSLLICLQKEMGRGHQGDPARRPPTAGLPGEGGDSAPRPQGPASQGTSKVTAGSWNSGLSLEMAEPLPQASRWA